MACKIWIKKLTNLSEKCMRQFRVKLVSQRVSYSILLIKMESCVLLFCALTTLLSHLSFYSTFFLPLR